MDQGEEQCCYVSLDKSRVQGICGQFSWHLPRPGPVGASSFTMHLTSPLQCSWGMTVCSRTDIHPILTQRLRCLPYVPASRVTHPDFRGPPKKLAHEVWQNGPAPAGTRSAVLCRRGGGMDCVLVQLSPCGMLTGPYWFLLDWLVSPLSWLEKSQLVSDKISLGVCIAPKILVALSPCQALF